MITIAALSMLAAASAQADCDPPGSTRLCRSSVAGPVCVATFDRPGEYPGFNEGNCEMVAATLNAKVRAWWCEPAAPDCDPGAVRLYRSLVDLPGRAHVATFDAPDGLDYNAQNCAIAAERAMAQPGVVVRYWCERVR